MLVAFDIGNTHLRAGFFRGDELLGIKKAPGDLLQDLDRARELLPAWFRDLGGMGSVEAIALASVVPGAGQGVRELFPGVPFLEVDSGCSFAFTNRTRTPETVGVDRLVNAQRALELFEPPLLVLDIGTAITLCALSPGPALLGGAILPGVGLAQEALTRGGAQLPEFALEAGPAIGRDTPEALASGILHGAAAAVEGLVARFRRELEAPEARLVATGGGARPLLALTELSYEDLPDLTLRGVASVARAEGFKWS